MANESLRAQLNTLQYELDSLKQEKELTALQQASEIRDAEKRAEQDFNRAQAAETSAQQNTKKLEQLSRELSDIENRHTNEKIQLERKIRLRYHDITPMGEDLRILARFTQPEE